MEDFRFLVKQLSLSLFRRGGYFDRKRWIFFYDLLSWYIRVVFGKVVPSNTVEQLTIILLNYRRPWNIPMIVRSALRCACVRKVIVCDNSATFCCRGPLTTARVELQVYPENRGTIARFEAAMADGGRYFLAMDDDVFLSPEQIHTLFRHLCKNPNVPHGVFGQDCQRGKEDVYAIVGREGPIDIISRVYAFTHEHVLAFFRVLDVLGIQNTEERRRLTFGDDIILSHSGAGKPSCHDLGSLLSCPTSSSKGIAVFQEEGFWEYRQQLFQKLALLRHVKQVQPGCLVTV